MTRDERPVAFSPNIRRGTVTLMMPDGRQVETYLRGAICWPVVVAGGRSEGAALLGCWTCLKRKLAVVEETVFACVDTIQDGQGGISAIGLVHWLAMCATTYGARHWMVEDSRSTHATYRRQVRESAMLASAAARPEFVTVPWPASADRDAEALRRTMDATRTLVLAKDGPSDRGIIEASVRLGADAPPVVQALRVLVYGMSAMPWRGEKLPFDGEAEMIYDREM